MTEPTELEKKLIARLNETSMPSDGVITLALRLEDEILRSILKDVMERRLKVEYLGQSSINNGRQERID